VLRKTDGRPAGLANWLPVSEARSQVAVGVKRVLVLAVGWAFILLGIAGLFLPILQGILFLLIGLAILSTEYVWAHHLLLKLRARFPGMAKYADQAKHRASAWLERLTGQRKQD
jgi:hypothetical protein